MSENQNKINKAEISAADWLQISNLIDSKIQQHENQQYIVGLWLMTVVATVDILILFCVFAK